MLCVQTIPGDEPEVGWISMAPDKNKKTQDNPAEDLAAEIADPLNWIDDLDVDGLTKEAILASDQGTRDGPPAQAKELEAKVAAAVVLALMRTMPKTAEKGTSGTIVLFVVEALPKLVDKFVKKIGVGDLAPYRDWIMWDGLIEAYRRRKDALVYIHLTTFLAECKNFHMAQVTSKGGAEEVGRMNSVRYLWNDVQTMVTTGDAAGGKEVFLRFIRILWEKYSSTAINQLKSLMPPSVATSRTKIAESIAPPVHEAFHQHVIPKLEQLWEDVLNDGA